MHCITLSHKLRFLRVLGLVRMYSDTAPHAMVAEIIAKGGMLKNANEMMRLAPIITTATIFERSEMLLSRSQFSGMGPNHWLLCSIAWICFELRM